jgi:hypothetical protein
MAHFGDMPQPLSGPAGHVALAAGFDHGDDRVFVASLGAVVSIDVDANPQRATPLLVNPESATKTAVVATPAASDGAAILVLAPTQTVVVGDPLSGQTATPAVFACGGGTSCQLRGDVPLQAFFLATSQSEALSAVWWFNGIMTTQDGARSFDARVLPASGAQIDSVAIADGRVWALVQLGGTTSVQWLAATGSRWTDVTARGDGLARSLSLVAIPNGPLLALLYDQGLRCSTDDGRTWGRTCS